jgi:S-adenosylmethionine-diacylglycerol 3-amino-3-carboxypropyl transferase
MPQVTAQTSTMSEALRRSPGQYHFVHLSNILDWLSPAQATSVLSLTALALQPGGYVLIRQLNSTLDIPSLGPDFDWLAEESEKLLETDRSFFYRSLHLGRRR